MKAEGTNEFAVSAGKAFRAIYRFGKGAEKVGKGLMQLGLGLLGLGLVGAFILALFFWIF